MHKSKYLICDCAIEINTPEEMLSEGMFSRFLGDFNKADFAFEISHTVQLPDEGGECIFDDGENTVLYTDGTQKYFTAFLDNATHDYVKRLCRVNRSRLFVHEKCKITELSVFEGIKLPELLLLMGIGLLHCSFIEHNGEAILFAGDKQVGKSTQASLWEKYAGATILNGDRAGLFFKNGKFFAGGVPFCGTSKICINRQLPVKAIVCLSKGVENRLKRISPIEAFTFLLGKFTYNTWDESAVNSVVDLVTSVVERIPVYSYSCVKDKSAVEYLCEHLEKGD